MGGVPPRSPLAPASFPDLPSVAGLRLATAAAGVKYRGRDDVMLAVLDPGSVVAGTFTRSRTRSAPVLDCEAKLGGDPSGPAAILVNAGNANAFTGRNGVAAVEAVTTAVAIATGAEIGRVFTSSTGVIGEPLPHDRITATLDQMVAQLGSGDFEAAADAIRTTDTFAKGAGGRVSLSGGEVTIAGIAKGSGMIAPDMATMLVYIFTDARIEQDRLQDMVRRLCDRTFNAITVDSDTSTSDTLLVAATGASGVDADDAFEAALHDVMLDLAHQVVRDGEGATKFVEITVTGAESEAEARKIGLSIANSPLVKTAIAGEDPNWGRVVMAVGKSGAAADRDRLSIRFGDILVATEGWVAPGYREEDGAAYMKNAELQIAVDVGVGDAQATVWTCDLTHGYISINADYRS
ncbi:bifunctional glutamate N-acetyltransferase/amino-acid acetyltransferase ArgJ [Pseudaestuariivita atlantica]|uniref:Arginine biosynthesis bifunctional protein ArgJ n=1 Tax=Pseudaestuariivita atlantica TaxID=1317121 RepID=A0A0L1JNN6_9RHOB|nr:bifunctional glutamate N-acetyltransferase/amino-acid acetyltransferase ArgJ [Pseudaestuariivita atlantica]KNG93332.1 N-acetylglutamate synthase [Pseudaestuariivita atlantica]